jgi:hypothetical protein
MNLDEVARGCDELHERSVDLVFKAWTGKVSHLVSSIAGCNIDKSDVGSSTVLLRANSATVAQDPVRESSKRRLMAPLKAGMTEHKIVSRNLMIHATFDQAR